MGTSLSPALLKHVRNQRSGSRLVIHDRLLADDPGLPVEERALVGLRNLVQQTPQAQETAVRILWQCRHALALVGPCGELSQRLTREWLEPESVWQRNVVGWASALGIEDVVELDTLAERRALDAEIELTTRLTRAGQLPAGDEITALRNAVRRRSYKPFVLAAAAAVFDHGEKAASLLVRDWLDAGELEQIVLEAGGRSSPAPGQVKEALWQIDFAAEPADVEPLVAAVRGRFGASLVAQLYPDAIALIDRIVREGTNASWGWRKRDLQRFAAECRRQLRELRRG